MMSADPSLKLRAYIDDSASDVGDRRLFLAGYINAEHVWSAFSAAWAALLSQPPSIAYLKMSEAQNLSGQFRGWTAEARDAKVLALAALPGVFGCWSGHASVSRKDHAEVLAPVAPVPLKPAYFTCWWTLIDTMTRYTAEVSGGAAPPLDFTFDDQGGAGSDAALWFPWLKLTHPDLASALGDTPRFADDKDEIPLQAADMLAWHLRRRHERGAAETLPAFDWLVGDGLHVFRDVGRETLSALAAGMRETPGLEFVQTKADWRIARRGLRASLAAGAAPPDTTLWRMRLRYWRVKFARAWSRWRYPRRQKQAGSR